uniref:Uncharacterized protein n=1 Tax=Oryza glumipatula TaxID=40148 RepID=A0A0E0BQ74_9ORYZ
MDLVFAGQSATAEAIANLIGKASSYLGSNPDRLQESMRVLRLELPIMCDTLVPAGLSRDHREPCLRMWLWRLRDAVEELEDAVDEHAYYEKKTKEREVNGDDDDDLGSSFSKMKQRFIKSLTNGRTLKRLRKAMEALDMVTVDIADWLQSDEQLDAHLPRQYSPLTSSMTSDDVFGRKKETDVIVRWLIDPLDYDDAPEAQVSPNNHHVSVISIVGHGGVGKSTLAQLVCNDMRIKHHFDWVAWLCVTSSFDVGRIMREIVECVTRSRCSSDSLENMQHILQDKLNSTKAFLLVLDDVWEENLHEWEKLFSVLRGINTRIKILLTTRTQSVATLVESVTGCEDQHLRLHELEEIGNLQLFCHHALADLKAGSEDYAVFLSIGAQIAKKLGGTPLAIKVASSYLRSHLTLDYWRSFLQDMDNFGAAVPDIMDVLKISYYKLSAELQSCFRYCSLCPKNHPFRKEELVRTWIWSGLMFPQVGKKDGELYLAQLTANLFLDRFGGENEEPAYYVMNDIMHDFATYVSQGECKRLTEAADSRNMKSSVRHISIAGINNFTVVDVKQLLRLTKLRTIIIEDCGNVEEDVVYSMAEVVKNSKSLRLLECSLFKMCHLPDRLSSLKHLRHVKTSML